MTPERMNEMKKLLLGCVAFSLLFTGFSHFDYTTTVDDVKPVIEYRVQQGDTLWSIAVAHNSANKDPRKIIRDIQKLNRIEAVIYPNEYLSIPVYE